MMRLVSHRRAISRTQCIRDTRRLACQILIRRHRLKLYILVARWLGNFFRFQRFQLPPGHRGSESPTPSIKMEPEDEACVPAGKSMQKVPSLSDLSDPESSLGEYTFWLIFLIMWLGKNRNVEMYFSIWKALYCKKFRFSSFSPGFLSSSQEESKQSYTVWRKLFSFWEHRAKCRRQKFISLHSLSCNLVSPSERGAFHFCAHQTSSRCRSSASSSAYFASSL